MVRPTRRRLRRLGAARDDHGRRQPRHLVRPDIDDEVLVAFGHGNPDHPYVVGALWNGQGRPAAVDGRRQQRQDDRLPPGHPDHPRRHAGRDSLTLSTPAGQKVTLSDADPGITLTDASQNSVQLGPGGITISTLAAVSIKALSLDIDAATVSVTAPAVTFAGVVTGNALATQVISGAMYSRGIGNLA